ncbi:4-hydroxythreonine-4-phosphate dehydrogenase PdxA [Piscirickettsia litoralis]|uniref:4-hydroxythreonine-4-phosphate dehydrogenase PdxA n=1 Tax=Piscirickettsia litoralis TaxID=1891921 RepID=UPI000980F0DD|nr:4-hydroxythreonine-4-phosphate dehydrogenase PdxA [Piscirickettsia litoralis]
MLPRLAITPGEPAGIGPDLILMLAQHAYPAALAVLADPGLLRQRAQHLALEIKIKELASLDQVQAHTPGELQVLPTKLTTPAIPGQLAKENAGYVIQSLEQAANTYLKGQIDGIVTGPVHKGIINDAGIPFSGHTEFFANITGEIPVMMLATETLRVALVTTHLPLSQVAGAITADKVRYTINTVHQDLRRYYGIKQPRILISGLNPHAGENGHLGHEEIDTIIPAIQVLSAQGINVSGPFAADTLFTEHHLKNADAVIAMYHDQGLPVLKYSGFGRAINITLGLSILRTSVDHGTALDLAGTDNIDPGSFDLAIKTAITIASQKGNNEITTRPHSPQALWAKFSP